CKPYLAAVKQYKDFLSWRKKFEGLPNHLIINFEDLILRKEETFKKVFDFLGFEFEQHVKDFINKYISDDPVKTYPRKPIETWPYRAFSVSPNKKIGSHKNILTGKEINEVNLLK
ncbi:unnamed protein product, partial [marine sediment metagenome]